MKLRLTTILLLLTVLCFKTQGQVIIEARTTKKAAALKTANADNNKDSYEAKRKKVETANTRQNVKRKRDPDEEDDNSTPTKRSRKDDSQDDKMVIEEPLLRKLDDDDLRKLSEAKDMATMDRILHDLKEAKKLTGDERGGYSATVTTSKPIDFTGQRDIQSMRHLITNLFYLSATLDRDNKLPVEFQLMRIRNKDGEEKFFIASNSRRSLLNIEPVFEMEAEDILKQLTQDFSNVAKTDDALARIKRFQQKLAEIYFYPDDKDEYADGRDVLRNILSGMQEGQAMKLDLIRKNTRELLENPQANILENDETSFFIVHGKNNLHAEMKFISMLRDMQKNDPHALDDCSINILGTRRPCGGCKGSMKLFADSQNHDDDEHTCHLHFTPEQGKTWTQSLLQLVQSTNDKKLLIPILRGLFEETYKSSEGAFGNDERSDDDLDEMDHDQKDEKE